MSDFWLGLIVLQLGLIVYALAWRLDEIISLLK